MRAMLSERVKRVRPVICENVLRNILALVFQLIPERQFAGFACSCFLDVFNLLEELAADLVALLPDHVGHLPLELLVHLLAHGDAGEIVG